MEIRKYGEKKILIADENEKLKQEVINLAKEVDRWNSYYDDEFNENLKLKDNWNKLKECLKDVMNSSEADDKEFVETILDIMQEIEKGT